MTVYKVDAARLTMHQIAVGTVDLDIVEPDSLAPLHSGEICLFEALNVFRGGCDRVGIVSRMERDLGWTLH